MAFLVMNERKLQKNYLFLNNLFSENNIKWTVVSKVLCGNKMYLKELINLGIKNICDSRLDNLKTIKEIDKNIETIYIKPPSKRDAPHIVKCSDISMNTEYSTIKLLANEAKKQNLKHKVIIMIEMGELREGVMREDFMKFYEKVFQLDNIEVVGIGTNFTCLSGVLPNQDKLIQLSLYAQLIEAKFNKVIPYVSGGSSVVIPLLLKNILPSGINHFRVGESLFFGTNVYNNSVIEKMQQNVFKLYAEIIELNEKPLVPSGFMGSNVEGDSKNIDNSNIGKYTYRGIINLGLLDVSENHIWPADKDIQFAGASSDMIVVDLKDNPRNYQVGDFIEFEMDYMGLLRLMNSRYIEKRIKHN